MGKQGGRWPGKLLHFSLPSPPEEFIFIYFPPLQATFREGGSRSLEGIGKVTNSALIVPNSEHEAGVLQRTT